MLKKTERITLVEQIALQLQSLIEKGTWPVGTKIPAEPELVAQLGVSRNTVREAVRAMVHTGLLITKQGDGTYVRSSSVLAGVLLQKIQQSDLLETMELRLALEEKAAQWAATRRSDEDLNIMRSCLRECEEAVKAGDLQAYAVSDIKLHQAIAEASGNRVFIELYGHMTDALQASVNNTVQLMSEPDFHQQAHKALVQAIADQNPVNASRAVHEYIHLLEEDLRTQMEEGP